MTNAIVLAVAVLLTLVATAGMVRPLRARSAPPIEPVPDDRLDELRLSLLRSLRDLRDSRSDGALDDATYERVAAEIEGTLDRVHDAIDRRLRTTDSGKAEG